MLACILKNIQYYIFVITISAAICFAYSGLIPPDPENPGKCVYRGDNLEVGANKTVAPCQRITCNADGSLLIEGCGRLRFESCNSGEREHPESPYPECCKIKYKCKREDGSSFYVEKDTSVMQTD